MWHFDVTRIELISAEVIRWVIWRLLIDVYWMIILVNVLLVFEIWDIFVVLLINVSMT